MHVSYFCGFSVPNIRFLVSNCQPLDPANMFTNFLRIFKEYHRKYNARWSEDKFGPITIMITIL